MVASSWLSTVAGAPVPEFAFLRAEGVIEGAQQQLQMEDRPGVDGFLVWLMGKKGAPFQMQTQADFASRENALAAYAAACNAVGQKRVLFRFGNNLGQVVVLGVSQLAIQPARTAIGGLNLSQGGNGFVLTLGWTLRGVS